MKWNLHTALAILQIVAISFLGVSPELFHHHEDTCHESHRNEQVDACHTSVHHGMQQCEDHNHVTESEYCATCNLFLVNTPIAETCLLQQLNHFQSRIELFEGEEQLQANTFHASHRLRGPPTA